MLSVGYDFRQVHMHLPATIQAIVSVQKQFEMPQRLNGIDTNEWMDELTMVKRIVMDDKSNWSFRFEFRFVLCFRLSNDNNDRFTLGSWSNSIFLNSTAQQITRKVLSHSREQHEKSCT